MAHFRKLPTDAKKLADISHTSQFCTEFRCHGNGGRSGENAIGSIRWPINENIPTDAKISQKFFTQAEL